LRDGKRIEIEAREPELEASAQSRALVELEYDGKVFHRDPEDEFFDLTEMCARFGKRLDHWLARDATKKFLAELVTSDPEILEFLATRAVGMSVLDVGKRTSKLFREIPNPYRGTPHTMGHPRVAIELAQWLDVKFKVVVNRWVTNKVMGCEEPAKSAEFDLDDIQSLKLLRQVAQN
jgi:hypothetical protein